MNGFREVVFLDHTGRPPWPLMKKLLTFPCSCNAQRSAKFTERSFNSFGRITQPSPNVRLHRVDLHHSLRPSTSTFAFCK